ncbi:MAG: hypothetical protein JWO40_296 [Candidatus Doudnabacteria bacterium]|nr:hypothetical protein [Candidatus Doudnabacteria bacterium]
MSWLGFALLCALFAAISAIMEKKTLFYEHAMEFSAVLSVIIAGLSLPFFFLINYSALDVKKVLLMLATATVGAIGSFFINRSARHMEISAASPLLVLGPVITTILAFFILNEHITTVQAIGIVILVAGGYILELKPGSKIIGPIREFIDSKFIHILFLGLFILSISSLLDRVILSRESVSVYAYLAFVNFFQALVYLIMLTFYHDGINGIKHGFKTAGYPLLIIAALTVSYRFFQATAVQLVYVGLALSIKRTSSIFTTLVGGKLFHEKNLIRRGFACLIMILGAILIALKL